MPSDWYSSMGADPSIIQEHPGESIFKLERRNSGDEERILARTRNSRAGLGDEGQMQQYSEHADRPPIARDWTAQPSGVS
jgi:hypothetical protein